MADTNEIMLTNTQDELLRWISESLVNHPEGTRSSVAAVNPAGGDFIEIDRQRRSIQYSDLEELEAKGLVRYAERGQMGASTRPVAERVSITADGLRYVESAGRPAQGQELSILLTDEQRETLVFLVEETRRSSGGQRHQFYAHRGGQNDILQSGDQRYPTFLPDLYELDATGLIRLRESENGVSFVVSPGGFALYEEVKRAQGEPIERVEGEARHLLERDVLDDFHEAAQTWRDAEDLLWSVDAAEQLTAIGHKCREALQAFAQALYERYCPDSEAVAKNKTVRKIRAVLSARRSVVGKTTEDFLIAYWGTVSDLAQRAAHDSEREDRPLLWEDGRRLVFQTLLVMVELAVATRP